MNRDEALGTAAHEASRFVDALGEWLSAHAAEGGPTWTHSGDEPIANGAPECRLCPICRLIAVARTTSPEVVAHLDEALRSLAAAFKCAGSRAGANGAESGFETIVIN